MEPIRGPFLLLFLTVTAVLILGCQASDSGNRDTSKPSPAKVLQATKSPPQHALYNLRIYRLQPQYSIVLTATGETRSPLVRLSIGR